MSGIRFVDQFPEEARRKFEEIAARFGIVSDLPSETLDGLILTAFYKNPEVIIVGNGQMIHKNVEEMTVKIDGETPKAYRVRITHNIHDPVTNRWRQETQTIFLPKSQCQVIANSFIVIPRWLAEKHFIIQKAWHLTLRTAFGYYISEFQMISS
jgi:hypothetical protein